MDAPEPVAESQAWDRAVKWSVLAAGVSAIVLAVGITRLPLDPYGWGVVAVAVVGVAVLTVVMRLIFWKCLGR